MTSTRSDPRAADLQACQSLAVGDGDPAERARAWEALGQPLEVARIGAELGDRALRDRADALWVDLRPELVERRRVNLDPGPPSPANAGHAPDVPEVPDSVDAALALLGPWRWMRTPAGFDPWRWAAGGWQCHRFGGQPAELRRLLGAGEPVLIGEVADPAWLHALAHERTPPFLDLTAPSFVVHAQAAARTLLVWTQDLSTVLADPTIYWIAGEDWAARLTEVLEDARLPIPERHLVHGEGAIDPGTLDRVLKTCAARRIARAERTFANLQARCSAPRSAPRPWNERVALITTRFSTVLQYVTRDLAEAFEGLGHEVLTIREHAPHERLDLAAIADELHAFDADCVIQVDGIRSSFPGLPAELPFVGWIQDRLPRLFAPDAIERLGPGDLMYGMWPGIVAECRAAGYPRVEVLPAAVNAARFATPPRRRAEFAAEVAFVSNVARPQPEALLPHVERYVQEHGYGHGRPAHYRAQREALERLGLQVPTEAREGFERQLYFDFERYLQRREVLRWVRDAGFDLRLYGRGWETDPELAPLARGPVAPGEELRDLYHSAAVHLQINLDTNVHPRVFECLAAGGLILAAATPDDSAPGGLGDLLAIGTEIHTFANRTQLLAQLTGMLGDPARRAAAIDAGRQRVLAEHTYAQRAQRILADVRGLGRVRAPQPGAVTASAPSARRVVSHPLAAKGVVA